MKELLERPISFHPVLARLFGGVGEAIYWQQLYYWSNKGGRPDGYIYKTKEEIEEETTLTRDQQDRIRKKLEAAGYLHTKLLRANGHPTIHYKVDFPLVEKALMEKRETRYSEKRETHEYITENTQRLHNSEQSSQKYEIVPDVEIKEKKPRKDANVLAVYKVFKEVTGKQPLNWTTNKNQRTSAENLYQERGLEQIRQALEFHRETKGEPFSPAIHTPYDLDSKWSKLFEFKKKHYGD